MQKKQFTKPLIATCSAILFGAGAYLVGMESAMAEAQDNADTSQMGPDSSSDAQHRSLPVKEIQDIIQAEGHGDNGVLDIEIARKDIGDVKGPQKDKKDVVEVPDVTFTPAFEIHGDLYFQPLSRGQALLNGDMALKEEEVNAFISALLKNRLVFQAFHQHLPMHYSEKDGQKTDGQKTDGQVWFVHFRGVGNPLDLARAIKAALDVTSTPFPQEQPKNPTSPLNADELASILHGSASVGDEGVVTVTVERTGPVIVDGVRVNPDAGISTVIEFKPVGDNGSQADVVPDFSMTAKEVNPVVKLMLKLHWYQGCLYNQETAEIPQLYFDHMLKRGDAYDLAREIRQGLDRTKSK